MDDKTSGSETINLPFDGNLSIIAALSLIVALILGGLSLASILYRSDIYPNQEYVEAFVPTDVAKLSIGLPVLLGSI